jgi:hypothetical protein
MNHQLSVETEGIGEIGASRAGRYGDGQREAAAHFGENSCVALAGLGSY